MNANILYKIDKNGQRLSDNISADPSNADDGNTWFESNEIEYLNLNRDDFVHFSAGDLPINNDYIVLQILPNLILCKKI